jgi:short-subunit dehydrogenase
MAVFQGKALFDLTGKRALVTGASSGLGRAMAGALASAGCSVFLAARRLEALEEAVSDISKSTGSHAQAISADLSTYDGVEALAKNVLEQGGVDILINAAGINLRQPCDEISVRTWEQTLLLNLGTMSPFSFLLQNHHQPPCRSYCLRLLQSS